MSGAKRESKTKVMEIKINRNDLSTEEDKIRIEVTKEEEEEEYFQVLIRDKKRDEIINFPYEALPKKKNKSKKCNKRCKGI